MVYDGTDVRNDSGVWVSDRRVVVAMGSRGSRSYVEQSWNRGVVKVVC